MDAPHHPVLRSRCVATRVLVPKRERAVYCLGGQFVETNFLVHAWQVFLCVSAARHGQKHGLFAAMRAPHEKGQMTMPGLRKTESRRAAVFGI